MTRQIPSDSVAASRPAQAPAAVAAGSSADSRPMRSAAPPVGSDEPVANWPAVASVAFSVAAIVIAELLPSSLLTPMARDLRVTEGAAGQTVTAATLAALVASLTLPRVTRSTDRRLMMLCFSGLLIVSSAMTALASSFALVIAARLLLGVAVGGFWALAAAFAIRLVPQAAVPRALSIVFGGVSVAMVAGAPLGSYFSEFVGWRGVFLGATGLGVLCWLWQLAVLPAMPPRPPGATSGIWAVARRPGVPAAMFALACIFGANMAFFTYMRPFYETVTGLGIEALSSLLLAFGIANALGTLLTGWALARRFALTLLLVPLLLAGVAAGLVLGGTSLVATTLLTFAWGFLFGAVPVSWSNWITRNLRDDIESAGGLQVAVIQLAGAIGAAAGGAIFDLRGATGPIMLAGLLMLVAALTVGARVRAAIEPAPGGPSPIDAAGKEDCAGDGPTGGQSPAPPVDERAGAQPGDHR